MKNIHRVNRKIYITNDEEIKEGDYYIDFTSNGIKIEHFKTKDDWVLVGICGSKKIILTTDQDLIADGVQAIDDEFLEWFVKNPSCEFVEVERKTIIEYEPIGHAGGVYKYKTIIPKEEPKQKVICTNDICQGECVECNFMTTVNIEEPKQETLEEVAERYVDTIPNLIYTSREGAIISFQAGAKWQQEQNKNLYSEEEVPTKLEPILAKISDINCLGKSEWYEVVYHDDKWNSYAGSKTFQNGEKVVNWKYCSEIFNQNKKK